MSGNGALAPDVTVAVIGAGTMGSGIAVVAAAAGHPVLLYDAAPGAAAIGIAPASPTFLVAPRPGRRPGHPLV